MAVDEAIDTLEGTSLFVKAAAVFLFGIIFLSGVISAANLNPSGLKTASITLTEIPQDGNTINIGGHIFRV
jgi:hypothetical protein